MRFSLISALALSVGMSIAASAHADEVVASVRDNTAGKSAGALTGVMLGGAAGGPLGALAGAGLGWLAGWGVQESSGLSENAYQVRSPEGAIQTVRSPKQTFRIGDQVEHRAGRLFSRNAAEASPAN